MKKTLLLLCLFFVGISNCKAQLCPLTTPYTNALIPLPNRILSSQTTSFSINSDTKITYTQTELQFNAESLKALIKDKMGLELEIISSNKKNNSSNLIKLNLNDKFKNSQEYSLQIEENRISIEGKTKSAIMYGIMTLRQILIGDICNTNKKQIASLVIEDKPRFAYRSLMLDPARNFLPISDIKKYIDIMAQYKYNVLQLHLTDDQGWRIEIKKYPKLTKGQPHYTQEDLKDLINYAQDRNIEIVPELDIPGHTVAVLAAYPELGCTPSDTVQKIIGKTENLMLCASNQQVYEMYQNIIQEVASIFSSPYIHLGGDEANIEKNWAKCDFCKATMKKNHYTKPSQLMIPFFKKILGSVRKTGKKPILWCELDNIYPPANDYLFPYDKDVTLVTWRNGLTPKCLELTHLHENPIIMSPGEFCYFDYPQLKGDLPEFNNWGMPTTTLEKSYKLDPGYGLPSDKQQHILGVMGTLWGEAIKDINRATYMTYPRGLALAEAGWTEMENRNWDSFKQRLYPNLSELMKQGISFRVPFEIAKQK